MLLATEASINQVIEPINSDGSVYGLGWYNAPDVAHYADGALRYEGNVGFDMQASDDVWNFVCRWCINDRAYPKSLDISPDGQHVYQYRTSGAYGIDKNSPGGGFNNFGAWATSLNLTTSPGSFVTSSIGMLAIYRLDKDPAGAANFADYKYIDQKLGVNGDPASGGGCTIIRNTYPLNPGGLSINPIAFWRTNAKLLYHSGGPTTYSVFSSGAVPQANLETVDWSVDLNNNAQPIYTANGTRFPTAVMMGTSSVTGNVTLFSQDGVFDPILGPTGVEGTPEKPFVRAEDFCFRVEIVTNPVTYPAAGSRVFMELPAVYVESDDYSVKGPSEAVTRAFGLKALGGRCQLGTTGYILPPLVMSKTDGTYWPPNE